MSSDDSRNDANLRQFASRAKQPKVLASNPKVQSGVVSTAPVQVFVVFDQGFGSISDQIDDTRFSYTGTSSQISQYERACARRTTQGCMADASNFAPGWRL